MNKLTKKIMSVVIAITMLFTVFAFAGCGSLTEHRQAAIQELQEYAYARGNHNFTPENWAAIQEYVENGTGAINSARSIDAIDTVLAEFRGLIGAVPSYIKVRYHGVSGVRLTEPRGLAQLDEIEIVSINNLDELNQHIADLEISGIDLDFNTRVDIGPCFANSAGYTVNIRNYLIDTFDYDFFTICYILVFSLSASMGRFIVIEKITAKGVIYFGISHSFIPTPSFYSVIIEAPKNFTPSTFSLIQTYLSWPEIG